MLGKHLDQMVQRRVRLMVSVIVVIPVVVGAAISNGIVERIEMLFRQEMEPNVVDVEDKQHRRQHTQPPDDRRWLGQPGPRRVLSSSYHVELL